jgi:hypothetical protein
MAWSRKTAAQLELQGAGANQGAAATALGVILGPRGETHSMTHAA